MNYLFKTDEGSGERVEMSVEPFSAAAEQNDYEVRRPTLPGSSARACR